MDFIDRKYLLIASQYLQGWTDMGQDRFNCRCPLCGDSKKRKNKKRGYFFQVDGSVVFKCHNCGASRGLQGMLEVISPELGSQYRFEKFAGKREDEKAQEEQRHKIQFSTDTSARLERAKTVLSDLKSISELDEDHPVRSYIDRRKIPTEFYGDLRYVPNIAKFIAKVPGYEETKLPERGAIAIPFFSDNKTLEYIQFRILNYDSLRYFTANLVKGDHKIWGLDRVDWNRRVYVCEGPFDAMFIDNGIAVAGASVFSIRKYLQEHCRAGYTLVFDRDYKTNAEIFALLKRAIEENESVLLYDRQVSGKDINDAVLENGWDRRALMEYIETNTKTGLGAKMALSSFKHPTKDKPEWHANRVMRK